MTLVSRVIFFESVWNQNKLKVLERPENIISIELLWTSNLKNYNFSSIRKHCFPILFSNYLIELILAINGTEVSDLRCHRTNDALKF